MQLVWRRLHVDAIHTAVVCRYPHQSVPIYIRRVNHVRQPVDRIHQLIFVVVIVTPTAAGRIHPRTALRVFQQEEVLSQTSRITTVQRRRKPFPLSESVAQDTVRIICLPDNAPTIHFCVLVRLAHLGEHPFRQTVIRLLRRDRAGCIQTIVMAVIRRPPNLLRFIFVYQVHTVVHMRLHAVVHGFEGLEHIAVKAVQSVPRTEPHEALLVLHDRHHRVLTHAVLDGVMLYHIVLLGGHVRHTSQQTDSPKKSFHCRS